MPTLELSRWLLSGPGHKYDDVTQPTSLLYRRLPTRQGLTAINRSADWQSVKRQVSKLMPLILRGPFFDDQWLIGLQAHHSKA